MGQAWVASFGVVIREARLEEAAHHGASQLPLRPDLWVSGKEVAVFDLSPIFGSPDASVGG
jgi:hypothetical protein